MKNIIATISTFLLFSFSAHATGFFIGADMLHSDARHKARNSSGTAFAPKDHSISEDRDFNFGANLGYRVDFLNLLASAEIFYDNLNSSSSNFELNGSSASAGDKIAIDNRYGGKINFGAAILPKITPFLTYGLTNNRYSSNIAAGNNSLSKSEMTPLYGVGILFDLPFGVSVKAAYDYQNFNMRYAGDSAKIRTHLGVARLGVIYNF